MLINSLATERETLEEFTRHRLNSPLSVRGERVAAAAAGRWFAAVRAGYLLHLLVFFFVNFLHSPTFFIRWLSD
jgi:hypothetical protein